MMVTSGRSWDWQLGLVNLAMSGALALGGGLSLIADFGDCANAQIAPDTTLGSESSRVTSTGSVDQIDGGATRGANLFHSFREFSVPTGGTAYFNNASAIQNIISRVTGESVSNIDGLIAANGTANLFLLNPNGIIFGPNAKLAIGGSFLASTASSLNFADGTQLGATAHPTTPLLTVSVPIGLQYGRTAGGIQVQQSILQVQTGQTLALMGGDVSVEGGEFGFLSALGGRVELGGLAGAGMVDIDGQQYEGAYGLTKLRFPDSVERADVLLTNVALVDVANGGGGSIAITARNINILGGSSLSGGLRRGLGFPGAQAGDIELSAIEAIAVTADSFISNNVGTEAVGKGGNIDITAESLSVTNGGLLVTNTRGQGDAGSVNIHVGSTVSLSGLGSDGLPSSTASQVFPSAKGNGGSINITAGSLSVTNGAQLSAATFGQGDAGSVNINARDTVSFNEGYGFSAVESGAVGNGGGINITAGSFSMTDGAQLVVNTRGQGDAGSVNINARDTVSFDGVDSNENSSGVFGNVVSGAVGQAGYIGITARSLSLTNGAQLVAATFGQGDAGSVNINVRDTVSLDGVGSNGRSSAIFSSVQRGGVGNGRGINITTNSLSVTSGATVSASTRGQGDGGNITVNANTLSALNGGQLLTDSLSSGKAGNITLNVIDSVTLAGSDPTYTARLAQFGGRVGNEGPASGLFANTSETSTAQGGDLTIATGQLIVQDGAQVTASSQGTGDAGDILNITARSLLLDNGSITTTSRSGQGGNIDRLQVQDLLLLRNKSNISTTAGLAGAGGNGGNITVDAPFIVAVPSENSDITANAFTGSGGRIDITTQGIFGIKFRDRPTSLSDITASSEFGVNGTVEINTPDVDPSQGLATLPAQLVEASELIATGCAALGESKFIVTGRGGLPENPTAPLDSDAVQVDLVTLNPREENRSSPTVSTTSTTPAPLVEAQGWEINDKGEVVLTAQAPNVTSYIPWLPSATCHTP